MHNEQPQAGVKPVFPDLKALLGLALRPFKRRVPRQGGQFSFRFAGQAVPIGNNARRRIGLALQGGGAHGAFTWGVIDRLLEDERFEIESASGTSAGALNAVVLASGLAEGGPDKARERLRELWQGIADIGNFSPFRRNLLDPLAAAWNSDWAASTFLYEFVTRTLSPYQLNPLAFNPLRELVGRLVDFERLRASKFKLFVTATNLHTGRQRVFTAREITPEVILASACLPSLNQAVEIEGQYYWDGGFTANPAILPMVMGCDSHDIVVVQVTPAREPEVPVTARDIQGRLNRIMFNAPLHREMQALAWMQDVLRGEGTGRGSSARRLKGLRLHHIDGEEIMRPMGTASALNADGAMVSHLYEQGRARATDWLAKNGHRVGIESTAALHAA
jgi:NTE family protein